MKSSSRRCSQEERRGERGGGGRGGERLKERKGAVGYRTKKTRLRICFSQIPAGSSLGHMRRNAASRTQKDTPWRLLNIPLWIHPQRRFSPQLVPPTAHSCVEERRSYGSWRYAPQQGITDMDAWALCVPSLSLSHMFKTQVTLCTSRQRSID